MNMSMLNQTGRRVGQAVANQMSLKVTVGCGSSKLVVSSRVHAYSGGLGIPTRTMLREMQTLGPFQKPLETFPVTDEAQDNEIEGKAIQSDPLFESRIMSPVDSRSDFEEERCSSLPSDADKDEYDRCMSASKGPFEVFSGVSSVDAFNAEDSHHHAILYQVAQGEYYDPLAVDISRSSQDESLVRDQEW